MPVAEPATGGRCSPMPRRHRGAAFPMRAWTLCVRWYQADTRVKDPRRRGIRARLGQSGVAFLWFLVVLATCLLLTLASVVAPCSLSESPVLRGAGNSDPGRMIELTFDATRGNMTNASPEAPSLFADARKEHTAPPLRAFPTPEEWPAYRRDGSLQARSPAHGSIVSPRIVWQQFVENDRTHVRCYEGDHDQRFAQDAKSLRRCA